jgi:hypothetical protein
MPCHEAAERTDGDDRTTDRRIAQVGGPCRNQSSRRGEQSHPRAVSTEIGVDVQRPRSCYVSGVQHQWQSEERKEAANWYEAQRTGLGSDFLQAVDVASKLITD